MKKLFTFIIAGLFPLISIALDPSADPNLGAAMSGGAGSLDLRKIGVESDKNKTADCDNCHAFNSPRKAPTVAKKSSTTGDVSPGSSKSDGADTSGP